MITALAIIGGIVGGVAIFAAILAVVWWWIVKHSPNGNPFL